MACFDDQRGRSDGRSRATRFRFNIVCRLSTARVRQCRVSARRLALCVTERTTIAGRVHGHAVAAAQRRFAGRARPEFSPRARNRLSRLPKLIAADTRPAAAPTRANRLRRKTISRDGSCRRSAAAFSAKRLRQSPTNPVAFRCRLSRLQSSACLPS